MMKSGLGILAVLITVTGLVWSGKDKSAGKTWGANTTGLKDRLVSIGLPPLVAEGTELHTHQHIDVWINEQKIQIPAGIGIGADQSFIAPIHTHDTTGIVHVESPSTQPYYWGQFLTIWGIKFPTNCQYYINGQRAGGNPDQIELAAHEEIAIMCGKTVKAPGSYNFPPGY